SARAPPPEHPTSALSPLSSLAAGPPPATPADAKGLLKAAIRGRDPVLFIEHSTMYQERGEVPEGADFVLPIGKSEVKRPGSDVTIITYSKMLQISLRAAKQLEAEGID